MASWRYQASTANAARSMAGQIEELLLVQMFESFYFQLSSLSLPPLRFDLTRDGSDFELLLIWGYLVLEKGELECWRFLASPSIADIFKTCKDMENLHLC